MENNYDIFKYLKPNENTKISHLRGYDLEELVTLINNYYLEYRDILNISKKASIGSEIEYDNPKDKSLVPILDNDTDYKMGWILREEGTVKTGGELCSPVFYNNKDSWEHFKRVLSELDGKVDISPSCGAHVHIGTQIMGDKARTWNNFLRLWSVYENIIFRFAYGEYLNGRDGIKRHTRPLRREIENYFKSVNYEYGKYVDYDIIMPFNEYDFCKHIKESRYNCVNLSNIYDFDKYRSYNTIEFRSANGTIDPVIWQNLINLYCHLLMYARNHLFDLDKIMKKEKELKFPMFEYDNYKYLDIIGACELSDLIFNDNLDKVYFLRQYLKNNVETDNKTLIKASKFTA